MSSSGSWSGARYADSYGVAVKPFLLLATRAEDVAADEEYEAFLASTGLGEGELVRHRLEQQPLGDVDLGDFSGVLLGGSLFTVSDPEEAKSATQLRVEAELRELVDRVVATDVPFLGACFGIGVLGGAQGAVVDRRHAEPVGAVTVTLTAQGRDDPLLGGLPDAFQAFVGHKEAISRLPDSAVLLASSATCPVQAFRVGRHAYATQFHAELDVPGIRTRIQVYRDAGYFAPDEVEALLADVGRAVVKHPPRVLRRFVELYG